MYHFKKILTTFALTVSSVLFLNGCNTVQGVGKDLEAGGKAISKAASSNQSQNHKTKAPTTSSVTNTKSVVYTNYPNNTQNSNYSANQGIVKDQPQSI